MKIINYLADKLFRHQKKLEIIAIFLLCLTISFRFTNFKTEWLWSDKTYIAVILVLMLISIALIWIKIEKVKTDNLIKLIKTEIIANRTNTENQLDKLSAKQKQVFDLIVTGKSNKEIMDELCIELSTLKTHINKIYKILGITSRQQIKKLKI
ncbi:MAG: helix-turn-helix transcriptional regulator [Saprospiraceae bacterium]|nr:helix-turn-helix transcriptional regulator [Candidatus Brachybacter algidus]MBK6611770.1 helix-turn-helix transcriptional regulator [Sphingobacteriales bacterium]MBK8652627.1 helix-turn-helix transcriptional regulator [Haliscomenobacter sp.]MBK8746658.1 helix-turn-helix transcriptional regulator [Candidatus Brachybacter algidus]MBK8820615.1 helix-turn-helix transcriptional regulator [Saprospiraceae bacterium]